MKIKDQRWCEVCRKPTINVSYCSHHCHRVDDHKRIKFNLLKAQSQDKAFGTHINITREVNRYNEGDIL